MCYNEKHYEKNNNYMFVVVLAGVGYFIFINSSPSKESAVIIDNQNCGTTTITASSTTVELIKPENKTESVSNFCPRAKYYCLSLWHRRNRAFICRWHSWWIFMEHCPSSLWFDGLFKSKSEYYSCKYKGDYYSSFNPDGLK